MPKHANSIQMDGLPTAQLHEMHKRSTHAETRQYIERILQDRGYYEPLGETPEKPKPKAGRLGNIPTMIGQTRCDSKAEALRYAFWADKPSCVHIDVHPRVSLDVEAGIHYRPDLAVWWHGPNGELLVHYEDIKSPVTLKKQSFRDRRRLFDQHHPAAPLWAVERDYKRKGWIVHRHGWDDWYQCGGVSW